MRISLLISHRCLTALSTLPDGHAWLVALSLLLAFTAIALPLGLNSKFLQPTLLPFSWRVWLSVLLVSLLTPAITEELFFRVLLLPHPSESLDGTTRILWGGIGLMLFLIYHPLNALTFFPKGRITFQQPIFLFLAGLLGIICTIAYWESGSVWPPIVLHWAIVVAWLLGLGGYNKLYAVTSASVALAASDLLPTDTTVESDPGTDP